MRMKTMKTNAMTMNHLYRALGLLVAFLAGLVAALGFALLMAHL